MDDREEGPTTRPIVPGRAPWVLADRYELDQVIGLGGMGEVWGGVDGWLDRPVAVKLLLRHQVGDEALTARFRHEARAMAQLNDPHVVTVHDVGEHDGKPYIVMERLPGRSFADELARAPLPVTQVLATVRATLSGLAAAHDAGVLHRDVKPSNILFGSSGRVKLADFGVAKREGVDLTNAGDIVGTFAYLAPERLDGEAATPRADLYAVGVIMYEALTGRRPFEGDTFELIQAIDRGDPTPLRSRRPDLGGDLVAVVQRAMHRRPGQRFPSAGAMLDALASVEVAHDPAPPRRVPAAAAPSAPTPAGDATVTSTMADVVSEDPVTEGARTRSTLVAVGVGAVVAAIVALGTLGDGVDDAVGVATGDGTSAEDGRSATTAPLASDPAGGGAAPATATIDPTTSTTTGAATAATMILQAPPVPTTAVPATLEDLVAALGVDPAVAGERGAELRDRLLVILGSDRKKQRDRARELLVDIAAWGGDGRLTPTVAATAADLLRPVADLDAGRDDED